MKTIRYLISMLDKLPAKTADNEKDQTLLSV